MHEAEGLVHEGPEELDLSHECRSGRLADQFKHFAKARAISGKKIFKRSVVFKDEALDFFVEVDPPLPWCPAISTWAVQSCTGISSVSASGIPLKVALLNQFCALL